MKGLIWKYLVLKLFRKEIDSVFNNGRLEEQGKMYAIDSSKFIISGSKEYQWR